MLPPRLFKEFREQIRQSIGQTRRFLPTHLALETSNACNAHCVMCPQARQTRPKGVLKEEDHKRMLERIAEWGAPLQLITHAGMGDPLTDKHLESRIALENRYFPNARIIVYTNAGLLDEERAKRLLDSPLDMLSVSLNALDPSTYERVMGISHAQTLANLERFIELRRELRVGMQLAVSLVPTPHCSEEEMRRFEAHWRERADEVVMPPWIGWGGWLEDEGRPAIEEPLPCSYLWKTLMVDHDGTVKMCCEDYDSRYPLGNLLETPPDAIFNSERVIRQREAHLSGNFSNPPICRNCVESGAPALEFWRAADLIPLAGGLDAGHLDLLDRARSLEGERYKVFLGHLLAAGLQANAFEFPKGVWPPPTPARSYIARFLDEFAPLVQGRVAEFHPGYYRPLFPRASSYDIWNIEPQPGVTLVADLERDDAIPEARFDAILCTHVLSALGDPKSAVRRLWRALAPGGVLLVTVPTVLQNWAPDPRDCWRFTQDGLSEVLSCFNRVELRTYGNPATAAGSPYYLMTGHFPYETLGRDDPSSPSIVAAAAWK